MISPKTGHALHFSFNQTEVKFRLFRGRIFAEFPPVGLDIKLIQSGHFAQNKMDLLDLGVAGFSCMGQYLMEYGSGEIGFGSVKHS